MSTGVHHGGGDADQEEILGTGHPDYLTTSDQLGQMILYQGRYADAERIWRQVLSSRRQNGDDDHPDNLRTRHNLARAVGAQRRYAEAERLLRQVLVSRQRILGDRHPEILETLGSLAAVTARQQRYDGARATMPPGSLRLTADLRNDASLSLENPA